MRPRSHCAALALVVATVLAGCAAQEKSAASPGPPAQGGAPVSPGEPPPPPVAAEEQDRGTAGESPRAALAHAKGDLDRAERELLTSAGDCASACRALASMERATGHLCALARAAGSQDDRSRCDEATAKVLEARVRVRSTCGTCEGGPSLERTAPIPSVRP